MEQVPQIYCLEDSNPQDEEEQVQGRLLQPLECFLFAEDPRAGLEKLKQGSASSQLCGRVFKEGETVYSCRSEEGHCCSVTRLSYRSSVRASLVFIKF